MHEHEIPSTRRDKVSQNLRAGDGGLGKDWYVESKTCTKKSVRTGWRREVEFVSV